MEEVYVLPSEARYRNLDISVGPVRTIKRDPQAWGPNLLRLSDGSLLFVRSNFIMRSADGGRTWEEEWQVSPINSRAHVQLSDGTVIGMSYYSIEKEHGEFVGTLWESKDNCKTFARIDAPVYIPNGVVSYSDGNYLHPGMPSSRSIVELDNGDLLWAMIGWFQGDVATCPHVPGVYNNRDLLQRMRRAFVVKSTDRGRSWSYLSTIAYDPDAGLEGFNETAMALLENGGLLAVMRTGGGQPMYQSRSTDQGKTWSKTIPTGVCGVFPDMTLMSNGVLACSYGRPGNNVMFSVDGTGKLWTHHTWIRASDRLLPGQYMQFTSGYTAIRESGPDELLFVFAVRGLIEAEGKPPTNCYRAANIKVKKKL